MLEFGPFRIDPSRREILRNGEPLALQAKPYDVLAYLIRHQDRVVEKREILDHVWPDTHVAESALFQAVSTLRKVLGDGKANGERYIATIPGRGYQFVGKAAPAAAVQTVDGSIGAEGPHGSPAESPGAREDSVGPQPSPASRDLETVGRVRWRLVAAAAAGAATILSTATWLDFKGPEPVPASTPVKRLTSLDGVEWQPGWSPDGRSFAYSGAAFGSFDIFVTATAGGDPLRRTADPADDLHPRWSPDGRYIAFLSDRGHGVDVYITSPFDGPERNVADTGLHRDVALLSGLGAQPRSPDSDSLLFPRRHTDGSIAVWKVELSTGKATQLTFPPPESEDRGASWSFDGRKLAFHSVRGPRQGVWIADADGRNEKRVAEQGGAPAWSADGRAIYLSRGSPINIWRLELESGDWSQVTLGAGQDLFPAIAGNGALAYASFRHTLNLHRSNLSNGSSEQLTSGTTNDRYARISPDGTRVAYQSDRTGSEDIWVRNLETGEELRLTRHPSPDTRPDWSPDGEKIAFLSRRDGGLRLWVVDARGGTPRRVAQRTIPDAGWRTAAVEGNAAPRWSPDGSRLAYIAPTGDGFALWLTALDGDAEPVASTAGAVNFGWYLDRDRIVLTRIGDDGVRETAALNLKTGRQRLLHRGPHYEIEVAADGSAFSFGEGISHANQNLFMLRLSPPGTEDGLPRPVGEPIRLTDGQGVWHVHNGGWFPDGQSVVYTRDTDQADIFMVRSR